MKKASFLFFLLWFLAQAGVLKSDNSHEDPTLQTGQSLQWSGYTQVRYSHGDDPDGFRIRRARVGLNGNILEIVSCKLQIDAVKSSILLDALVEIQLAPQAKLSFGQFKVPFSLENLTSSSALDLINRSQTVENLCPGRDIGAQGRDIGISVSGKFRRIEYFLGIFNGSGINREDDNDQKDAAGRLIFNPSRFFSLGISHYNGKASLHPGIPAEKKERSGVDMFVESGQLSLKAEWIFAKDGLTERFGFYVQGGFFLIPEEIQALIRVDLLDRNIDIREDRSTVVILGLNWFLSKKTKFQINYEYHAQESKAPSNSVLLAQFQAGF